MDFAKMGSEPIKYHSVSCLTDDNWWKHHEEPHLLLNKTPVSPIANKNTDGIPQMRAKNPSKFSVSCDPIAKRLL